MKKKKRTKSMKAANPTFDTELKDLKQAVLLLLEKIRKVEKNHRELKAKESNQHENN